MSVVKPPTLSAMLRAMVESALVRLPPLIASGAATVPLPDTDLDAVAHRLFYIKRYSIILNQQHSFLKGKWISSKQYSGSEIVNRFAIKPSALMITSNSYAIVTKMEWLEIIPLKHLKVIK